MMATLTVFSQPAVLNSAEKLMLNKVIDSMYTVDQENRTNLERIDSIFGVEEMTFMFHKSKKILQERVGEKYKEYSKKIDSTINAMKLSDSLNSRKLLEITKAFGFPGSERLGVKTEKAYMIFVHSPSYFFTEIEQVINQEFKQGRISEYCKEYIFWHLNGRQGLPPRLGENGKVILSERNKN
jgi:hypothetical protein